MFDPNTWADTASDIGWYVMFGGTVVMLGKYWRDLRIAEAQADRDVELARVAADECDCGDEGTDYVLTQAAPDVYAENNAESTDEAHTLMAPNTEPTMRLTSHGERHFWRESCDGEPVCKPA